MRIIWTKHALELLAQRGIAKAWVATTIAEPDWRRADSNDPALMIAFRRIGEMEDRILRVVYAPGFDGSARIVTVLFDRNAAKGLRKDR